MTGKKQFEEAKALDHALVAFWHAGYQATSYPDLEAATGLNKSSLYNAFGAKSDLYQKCLARFEQTCEQPLLDQLQQSGLRRVLAAYFEGLFEHFADTSIPCGCLAGMAALASNPADMQQMADRQHDRLGALLAARFQRAVAEGELPENTDTGALSALFVVLSRGLARMHRDADMQVMRRALTGAMAVLDAPPRKSRAPGAQTG